MNILLLGNGLDIYHKLPTKYHNFLNVVKFLIENKDATFTTVEDVLGNQKLHLEDGFIFECYEQHKTAYANTLVNNSELDKLVRLCEENVWYNYLSKSFNMDIGWIDFEKEIAFVLKCFKRFLDTCDTTFEPYAQLKDKDYIHVIKEFDFFHKAINRNPPNSGFYYKVEDDFTLEYPLGSKNIILDKDKIVNKLADELFELAKALQIYLTSFVDATFSAIKEDASYEQCKAISNVDYAIIFNYTNTYEQLYLNTITTHIHGNVNDRIILGVNPDESDVLDTIDTVLIRFKKYFQRVLLGTDDDFWEFRKALHEDNEHVLLMIMGHSLDVTDEDIITELFYESNEIYVLYHNEAAKASYISNLVRIFGKEDFDDIRQNKMLKFLPLDMDFTEFAKNLETKAFAKIAEDIERYL